MSVCWTIALFVLIGFLTPPPRASGSNQEPAGIPITSEEQKWIRQHPVVRVYVAPDYPPFEMRREGIWQGMAYDYLREAASRIGLRTEVSGVGWPDALERIQQCKDVDLILTLANSPDRARISLLTQPYLVFPLVIVTRKEGHFVSGIRNLDQKTVAIEKGYIYAEWLRRDLPGARLKESGDSTAALKLVSNGQADAYVGNLAVASYVMEHQGLTNLKIAAPADNWINELSMGVRKDWPELVALLDKSLKSFSSDDHQKIRQKWLAIRYEYGIGYRDVVLWGILLAFAAAMFIIPLKIMVRRRTRELLEKKNLVEAFMDNTFQYQGLLAPDGKLLQINKTARNIIHAPDEQLFGRYFWETPWWRHSEEERERLRKSIRQCAEGNLVRNEVTNMDQDDNLVFLDFSLKPLRDQDGRIISLIVEGRDVTDRKKAEESLRESKERFEAIFDESPIIITLNKLDTGKFFDVNRRYCEVNGLEKSEVLGKSSAELGFISGPEHARLLEIFQRQGFIDQEEIVTTSHQGVVRTLLLSTRVIRIAGEQYALSMMIDITARKNAEKALRERETQLQLYIERIPVACILWDTDCRVQRWNPMAEKVFGYTAGEVSGRTADELIVPVSFQSSLHQIWEILLKGNLDAHSINENLTKDGRTILCEWTNTPFHDTEGNIVGIISMVQDITERRRAEDALKANEMRLRSIAQSVTDVIWVMDDKRRFTFVSPSVERIHGWTPEEMLSVDLSQAVAPHSLGKAIEVITEETSFSGANEHPSGKIRVVELELLRKNGESFWGEISASFIFSDDGQSYTIIGTTRDITERKKTQQMMIETEKMLTVSGLAAGMAHEINNPLGVILQSLQNIERRVRPDLKPNIEDAQKIGVDLERVREYLKKREILDFIATSRRAGERAAKIITNMLAFSRKGRSGIFPANIHKVIDNSIELAQSDFDLKKKFDFRNIRIVREYSNNLDWVSLNETEIEQVLLNLLKNAAQALSQQKSPEPAIVIRTDLQGNHAVITVADNGPGIPQDLQKRIIEPFFTTKEIGTGTGLGLYVSYAIITNNHKGSFSVDSTPGEGARFTIRLPIDVVHG